MGPRRTRSSSSTMDQEKELEGINPVPKNNAHIEASQVPPRTGGGSEETLESLDKCLSQQEPEITVQGLERVSTDPAPSGAAQPLEDIIQTLDDHIAASPNPAQAPTKKETDSGLEEQESDNGSENQIVDVVATSASDEEDIIVVDPTTVETYSEVGVQILTRLISDKPEKEVHGQKGRETQS